MSRAQARARTGALPRLLLVVTGRGPQREAFRAALAAEDLRWVAVRTLWLAPREYPRLLGAADLGVCLHTSSSGLDLPMKVWAFRQECQRRLHRVCRHTARCGWHQAPTASCWAQPTWASAGTRPPWAWELPKKVYAYARTQPGGCWRLRA